MPGQVQCLIEECRVITGDGRVIELTEEDVARLTGEKPLAKRQLALVKSGPPVPCPPKFEDFEDPYTGIENPYWYRWQLAEYDTEKDIIVFRDWLTGETYDLFTFPASEFEIEKNSIEPYVRVRPPIELEEEDAWP